MDGEEARTIGRRVRQLRYARDKSLRVVAGLAGMSKSQLDRIERGEVALDKLSEIVALANALQIAPSDLMRLPVRAPANGHTDSTVEAVRLALMAVSHGQPDGLVLPVDAVRARVTATVDALCRCDREREVGAALPGLIRDLHAGIAAGRDVTELLGAGGMVAHASHRSVAEPLGCLGRPVLTGRDAGPARRSGARHRGPDGSRCRCWREGGARRWGVRSRAGRAGRGGPCRRTPRRRCSSQASSRCAGRWSPRRTSAPATWLRRWRTPVSWRCAPGRATPTGWASRQVAYWADYGRALARLRGRHDDAVMALRRAELISPHLIQRGPVVRDVLAELLVRVPRDSRAGRESRRMAYRADVQV